VYKYKNPNKYTQKLTRKTQKTNSPETNNKKTKKQANTKPTQFFSYQMLQTVIWLQAAKIRVPDRSSFSQCS